MKKKFIFALPIITAIIFGTILLFKHGAVLTEDQNNTREILGNPSQFVIAYLPRGEDELVRSESWYFADSKKKVDFLGGEFVAESEWLPDAEVSPTNLLPENFDFMQDYEDVSEVLGDGEIEELDYLPPFYDDDGNIKTYYCEMAVFIIENSQLTYFQTLGVGDKTYYESELSAFDITPTPTIGTEYKSYISSDLGFEMKYPAEWFLEYGVLSSYDTGYLEKGLTLPEKRLKCDFNKYNPDDVEIGSKTEVINTEIKVYKGVGVSKINEEGPGLGDSIMFMIEKEGKTPMSLLCFSYNDEFEAKLIESLKTFKFLD